METKLMWGLPKQEYEKRASAHSKANIVLWLVGGIGYNLITGHLFSWSTALLIVPGIFIASFASMPTLWVEIQKERIVPKTSNVFVLLAFTIWMIIDLLYPVILGILFAVLLNLL